MNTQWLFPDNEQRILNGKFYVTRTEMQAAFTTIKDGLHGYNVLRVNWEGESADDRATFMCNMLEVARIKYEDLKEKNGQTATV